MTVTRIIPPYVRAFAIHSKKADAFSFHTIEKYSLNIDKKTAEPV